MLADDQSQRSADRLVEQNLHYCVSALVRTAMMEGWDSDQLVDNVAYRTDWKTAANEYLLTLSSIEMLRLCEENEIEVPTNQETLVPDLHYAIMDHLYKLDLFQDFCQSSSRSIEPHEDEVYEHWVVSDWLADKLKEKGECICLDWQGLTIWGRCTTGQMVSMDSVIREIAEELQLG